MNSADRVAEVLANIKNNTYCRLKPSPVHGIGVFAIRDIEKGMNPFVLRGRSHAWIGIKERDFRSFHPEIIDMIRAYFVKDKGKFWVHAQGLNALTIEFYLNHSKEPNLIYDVPNEEFITTRVIRAGEELLIDYSVLKEEPFTLEE